MTRTIIWDYFELAKSRMVLGNDIVAAAAFIFGSQSAINWPLFWLMLGGLSLVIGSACVFNNWYDRRIDGKMARTQGRALPSGRVDPAGALTLGWVLLAGGIALLYYTNAFVLGAALGGWVVYVLLYTPLKSHSSLALFVGAAAGATPPLVGYAAAAGTLDLLAFELFVLLFLWQIPHFLAIARYRFDEYTAAGVPLFARKPASEVERSDARLIFKVSLVGLLLMCALLVLLRLFV